MYTYMQRFLASVLITAMQQVNYIYTVYTIYFLILVIEKYYINVYLHAAVLCIHVIYRYEACCHVWIHKAIMVPVSLITRKQIEKFIHAICLNKALFRIYEVNTLYKVNRH